MFLLHDLPLLSYLLHCVYSGVPYSTVDGRCLVAVANTLRALVVGGVH